MKNEKGFVFPLTLGIVLLSFFILTASVQIYLSEERYLKETEEYYYENSLNTMAIKSLATDINTGDYSDKGILIYENGKVNFSIQKNENDQYTIVLQTSFDNGRTLQNKVLYNQKEQRIDKWYE